MSIGHIPKSQDTFVRLPLGADTAPVVMPHTGGALSRHVLVAPGMCGGGSLFFGRIGDWTWETVAASCGMNVHAARTPEGQPTYLSFYYYRVRGGDVIHTQSLSFGDELRVTSRAFQFGSQSVITLHRVAPADLHLPDENLDPAEVYENPRPECLYAENFNRWIVRGNADSNRGLALATPQGFAYHDLPQLPNTYSPRTLVGRARTAGSFHPDGPSGYAEACAPQTLEYTLDVVRDLNGVGLMYFAAYFSVFDAALLRVWNSFGRTTKEFLRRKVRDQQIGYFGNADPGAVFTITVRTWRNVVHPHIEMADMAMRDKATGQLIAVTAIETEISQQHASVLSL